MRNLFYLSVVALCMPLAQLCAVGTDSLTSYVAWARLAGGIGIGDVGGESPSGMKTCCEPFKNSPGYSLEAMIGVDYHYWRNTQGLNASLGLGIGLLRVGSRGSVNEFIGNVIHGNQVLPGISSFSLESSITPIAVEPTILLNHAVLPGLFLRIGPGLAIPIASAYAEKEELLHPSDPGFTYENGERTRYDVSGAVPKVVPFLLIASTLGYQVNLNRNWFLSADVSYRHSVTSVSKSSSLTISPVNAGITIGYRIPMPTTIQPPPPDSLPQHRFVPPPPAVIVKKKPPSVSLSMADSTMVYVDKGRYTIKNGVDTAIINHRSYPSVLFYEFNSVNLLDSAIGVAIARQVGVQARRLVSKVKLTAGVTTDEAAEIGRQRIVHAMNLIEVPANLLEVETRTHGDTRKTDLNAENRNVVVATSSSLSIVRIPVDTVVKGSVWTRSFLALTSVQCESEPCSVSINAEVKGREIPVAQLRENVYSFQINDNELRSTGKVVVIAKVTDAAGYEANDTLSVVLTPVTDSTVERLNEEGTTAGMSNGILRTLGFFAFDGDSLIAVDEDVVLDIKHAIETGKSVTMIPRSDAYGTEDYNRALRRRRARAATDRLGELSGKVVILLDSKENRTTGLSYEMIRQRSVQVVIER